MSLKKDNIKAGGALPLFIDNTVSTVGSQLCLET